VLKSESSTIQKKAEWGNPGVSPLFWCCCLALLILWFLPLGYRDLIRSDEGRYAEIAREMWLSGDWTTPRLNGLKYFEKPPLQYWATALFYTLWGASAWTARLWPAITGLAGIGLTLLWGRRLVSLPVAGMAALIQASLLWYMGIAHFNVLDMGLCFFLYWILLAYARYISSDSLGVEENVVLERKRCAWLIGVGIAGAFLSKGLVAIVLPGMVFVADSIWHRDRSPWQWRAQWRIWSIALALAVPWCLLISMRNPEFPHFFFIHEHFERFSADAHHREGPIYYFIPILLIGLLPWTFFWLKSLCDWPGLVRGLCLAPDDQATAIPTHLRFQRLLMVWSVLIFAFFSVSHSKLPSYILPIFPSLAWLLSFSLTRRSIQSWRVIHAYTLVLWGGIMIALPFISIHLSDEWTRQLYTRYRPYVMAGVGCIALGSMLFLWMTRTFYKQGHEVGVQGRYPLWMTWMLPMMLWSLGMQIAFQGHQVFSPRQSICPLVQEIIQRHGDFNRHWAFYSVESYEQTLDFYIDRTTTLVHFEDELAFGCQQEPFRCISTVQEWKSRWIGSKENAYAMMSDSLYVELQSRVPMQVLGRNSRYIIVKRYP
jgi:4-amino-4-deoxy-L-arabinose transferase-like glycosyltransferase